MEVGSAYVRVRPDMRGFKAETEAGVNSAFSSAARTAGKILGGAFAAKGIFDSLKSVVDAATEHQAAFAVLDQTLENAGLSAKGLSAELEKTLEAEARLKGFSDEDLASSMIRLVSVTKDVPRALADVRLAEDLARARHIGLAQAALALSKAEQGSVTALARYGIVIPKVGAAQSALTAEHDRATAAGVKFTGALAEQYKAQLAAATATDKQGRIELARSLILERFGGSAGKFADTASGQFQRLGQDIHQFEVAIGSALLPGLADAAEGIGHFFGEASQNEGLRQGAVETVHDLGTTFHDLGEILKPVVPLVGAFVGAAAKVAEAVDVPRLVSGYLAYKAIGLGLRVIEGAAVKATASLVASTSAKTADTAATTRSVGATGEAAGVTTAYTEALIANTAALEGNAAASRLALGGFNTIGGGAAKAERELQAVTGTATVGRGRFAAFALSGKGMASVLSSGIAPAAILAGYELSKLIEKIPGWEKAFKGFGGFLEGVAEKIGLVSKGIDHASAEAAKSLDDPKVQAKLAAAYKKAAALPSFARDAFIQAQVGPGFTFHDAEVFKNAAVKRAVGGESSRIASDAANRPTDAEQKAIAAAENAIEKAAEAAIRTTNKKLDEVRAAAKQKISQLDQDLTNLQESLNQAILQRQQDLTNAITQAKQNLDSIGQQISSDISNIIDRPLQQAQEKATAQQNRQSLEQLRRSAQLPGGNQLSTNPQKALAQLEALARQAGNTNRAAIENFIAQYKQAVLAVQTDQATVVKERITRQIADLTDSLNRNKITPATFRKRLLADLQADIGNYKKAGGQLGSAFQNALTDEVDAAIKQAQQIGAAPHRKGGGSQPQIIKPLEVFHRDTREIVRIQQEIGNKQIAIQNAIHTEAKKTNALLTTLAAQTKIAHPSTTKAVPGHQAATTRAGNGTHN